MNLMFWKKTATTGGESEGLPDEADGKAVARASSLRERPDSADEASGDEAHIKAARLKKRMVIFGAIGLSVLILLVLAAAVWKLFFAEPPREAAPPDSATEQKVLLPSPHREKNLIKLPGIELPPSATPQAELDALRKKNEELEGQLKELKQQDRQSAPAETAAPVQGNVPAASRGGEVVRGGEITQGGEVRLGSKDPKATAMTLKAAIEIMNAGTGDYAKKPPAQGPARKPQP